MNETQTHIITSYYHNLYDFVPYRVIHFAAFFEDVDNINKAGVFLGEIPKLR